MDVDDDFYIIVVEDDEDTRDSTSQEGVIDQSDSFRDIKIEPEITEEDAEAYDEQELPDTYVKEDFDEFLFDQKPNVADNEEIIKLFPSSTKFEFELLDKDDKSIVLLYREKLLELIYHDYGKFSNIETFCVLDVDHYRCSRCDMVGADQFEVITHFKSKHHFKFKKCLACSTEFQRFTQLLKHERICEAPSASLLRIARSSLGQSLTRPSKAARKRIKVPCGVCNKLIRQSNMTLHLNTHSNEKRYGCSECSARFRTMRSLNAHMNAHRGHRPYRCDLCPKAYTSDTALRAHRSDHLAETYKCEYCGRGYSRKYTLTQHVKTLHEGDRPFLCMECGQRFSYQRTLDAHLRKHLGLPSAHPCTLCHKSFTKMGSLKGHMKRFHGIDIITRKMFYNRLPQMKVDSLLEEDPDNPDEVIYLHDLQDHQIAAESTDTPNEDYVNYTVNDENLVTNNEDDENLVENDENLVENDENFVENDENVSAGNLAENFIENTECLSDNEENAVNTTNLTKTKYLPLKYNIKVVRLNKSKEISQN